MAKVKFTWNRGEYSRLVARGGPVDQSVRRAAGRTRDRAKRIITAKGRVDTGRLRNSIVAEHSRSNATQVWWVVGSNLEYAAYQEDGTRAHGPRRARVLRFKPKGSNSFVFAKRVRGVKPAKFLQGALNQLKESDFD